MEFIDHAIHQRDFPLAPRKRKGKGTGEKENGLGLSKVKRRRRKPSAIRTCLPKGYLRYPDVYYVYGCAILMEALWRPFLRDRIPAMPLSQSGAGNNSKAESIPTYTAGAPDVQSRSSSPESHFRASGAQSTAACRYFAVLSLQSHIDPLA